jgi:hypothetical protein
MARKLKDTDSALYFRASSGRRVVDATTLVKLVQAVVGGMSIPAHMEWLRPEGLELRLEQYRVKEPSHWNVQKWK